MFVEHKQAIVLTEHCCCQSKRLAVRATWLRRRLVRAILLSPSPSTMAPTKATKRKAGPSKRGPREKPVEEKEKTPAAINGADWRCSDAKKKIAQDIPDKRIGYPRIGAGMAGGDWEIISSIIAEELEGLDHTLVLSSPQRQQQPTKQASRKKAKEGCAKKGQSTNTKQFGKKKLR